MTFKYSLGAYCAIVAAAITLFMYGLTTNDMVVVVITALMAVAISTGKAQLPKSPKESK